jgi:hypothetical protein
MLLFAGCSQSSKPAASGASGAAMAPTSPPELVTAKTAFWPMYRSALTWSSDVQVMRVSPKSIPGFNNEAGKAAMWEAAIASPSHHQYRVYTYAIVTALPDIHKGVSAGIPLHWAGQSRDAMPIDVSAFNVDSDAAFKTSAVDAGSWLTNNRDKQLSSLDLGSNYKFQSPVWYVAWGDKKSGYIALVDANSGTLFKSK